MRQVDRAVGGVRPLVLVAENVQVVTRHTSQDFGPMGVHLAGVLLHQVAHKVANLAHAALGLFIGAKFQKTAVGQPSLSPQHVVHHVAVSNRAAAARVVARHTAQGGLGAGGHVHRIPQAMRFEGRIQVVEHQARLHGSGALLGIDRHDLAHVFGVVNHQTRAHGLAALAGAAATRHDGHAQVPANVQRHAHIGFVTRHKNPHRHDLVNRGIGGVAAPIGRRKQDFTLGVRAQPLGQQTGHLVEVARHRLVALVW